MEIFVSFHYIVIIVNKVKKKTLSNPLLERLMICFWKETFASTY
jgi:hypothetical protein